MALNRSKERNESYLKWLFSIILITMLFYTFKYNFIYKVYEYNYIIFSLVGLFIAVGPLYIFTKKFNLAALLMFFITTSFVSFLVYTAGGMIAPGVFWLSIYPFVGGILLGKRGSYLGGFVMLFTYTLYLSLDHFGLISQLAVIHENFDKEKAINVFLFSLTSFLTTLYFLKEEESAQVTVENQKKEIEVLLRILMHDVATPLSAIQGSVFLIRKQEADLPNSFEKYIEIIERSSSAMANILTQMKNITVVNDGKICVRPENVNEIIFSTIEFVKFRADNKKISFKIDLDSSNPMILVEAIFFKVSILSNLLTNAIKFSNENSQIAISSKVINNNVYIIIKDDGIGMPNNVLKNIFNISSKTSRVGTQGEVGTGYGMPILKAFVEKFAGTVEVTSVEQNGNGISSGTTFTLCFKKHDITSTPQ